MLAAPRLGLPAMGVDILLYNYQSYVLSDLAERLVLI